MAKRKPGANRKKATASRKKTRRAARPKRAMARRAGGKRRAARPSRTRTKIVRKKAAAPKRRVKRSATVRVARAPRPSPASRKSPRLERARRTLEDIVQTPPSSLNMDRKGSAARTGRAEIAENLAKHGSGAIDIAGGDVDVNLDNAYFSGDEAPGGDNPTPDQDIVDDIGKALGIEYQDQEELKSSEKLIERDKHRWELDPASSEDYKDRK